MRIAFIVSVFPTLSETFILNQITGLIDRGHEVDIFARGRGNTLKIHSDVEKYNLLERAYYPKIPTNKFLRALKAVWLIFVNFHKNPLTILRSLNVFKYKRQALSLRLLYIALLYIDKKPYDIIHCHYGQNGLRGLKLRELGFIHGKLVTAFHGTDMSGYLSRYDDGVYKGLFASGDLFLPISELWRKKLIKLGCPKEKVLVHRMGVTVGDSELAKATESESRGKTEILSIARLVEKKGIEYGIRAVKKVKAKGYTLKYKIVGDGYLRKELEGIVRDLGLQDTVAFLGSKSKKEVNLLLRGADILLAPSVTDSDGNKEGIPVALMEAMAVGLPVVSTLHSGIPELVQDGVSGFLVPERDVDALAERLVYLIEHPEIWPKMGRAGRAHVEANYNIHKLNDRLVEIYQSVLNGRIAGH